MKKNDEVKSILSEITIGTIQEMINNSIQEALEPYKVLLNRQRCSSIHKTEDFNGEEPTERIETNLKMKYEDKVISARNACKILPPNLIINGRHDAKNIGAICGFIIDEDMMEDIYNGFSHD